MQAFREGNERKLRNDPQGKAKKEAWKKLKKVWKKSWQRRVYMIYSLSCLKNGQRIGPWKLNNEIRKGTRDSIVQDTINEEFLKYFSNSNTEAKIAKYKKRQQWRMSEQSSENDFNTKVLQYNF